MTNQIARLFLSAAAAALLCAVPVSAQSGTAPGGAVKSDALRAIPRTAEGRPDFSGFWDYPKSLGVKAGPATVFDKSLMPPLKPGGEAFFEPRTGDPYHDEPRSYCMPSGFPSNLFAPYPVQIVQNKDWMVMLPEFMRFPRMIPLDGRAHRDGIEPTYYGDSVGKWDGDTLVIDSTNFKRWSLDDYYYAVPAEYRMHSDAFHTVERLRRVDANTLSYVLTVDDPKIFSKPWTQEFAMKFRPDWDKVGLYEFICEENNRCVGGQCRGDSGK